MRQRIITFPHNTSGLMRIKQLLIYRPTRIVLKGFIHKCSLINPQDTTIDYLLSNQYIKSETALDGAILKALEKCDTGKKERILKMIDLM